MSKINEAKNLLPDDVDVTDLDDIICERELTNAEIDRIISGLPL